MNTKKKKLAKGPRVSDGARKVQSAKSIESGTRRGSRAQAGWQISRDGNDLQLELHDVRFRGSTDSEARLAVRIPLSWAKPMAEALQKSLIDAYVPRLVYRAAWGLLENDSAVVRWCLTPSRPLRGKTPLDVCADGRYKEVLELLLKIEHGIF